MNHWTACLGEGARVSGFVLTNPELTLVQFVAATFAWPYLYNKLQTGDLAVWRVVHFLALRWPVRPGGLRLCGTANLVRSGEDRA